MSHHRGFPLSFLFYPRLYKPTAKGAAVKTAIFNGRGLAALAVGHQATRY
jgi:hypothetical protein